MVLNRYWAGARILLSQDKNTVMWTIFMSCSTGVEVADVVLFLKTMRL